jgi:hypothetical protein
MWPFSRQFVRATLVLLQMVLISGIPLPLVDSHDTSSQGLSDTPFLALHLQSFPATDHENVDGMHWHLHWISIFASPLSPDGDTPLKSSIDQHSVLFLCSNLNNSHLGPVVEGFHSSPDYDETAFERSVSIKSAACSALSLFGLSSTRLVI